MASLASHGIFAGSQLYLAVAWKKLRRIKCAPRLATARVRNTMRSAMTGAASRELP
jgi:hypothetical protein